MTRSRHVVGALALAALLAVALLPGAAAASKADAFEGKIQPVSGQLFRKSGRLELTLGGDLSLNDAFFRKRLADVKLGFHFNEQWSGSLHGAFGSAVATASTTVCPTGQACHSATSSQLDQVPGRIHGLAGAEVAWSPIYGKLNTFSEKVAHIDLSVLVGLDYLMVDKVLSIDEAKAGVQPTQEQVIGGHAGVGLRLFLAEMAAVRLELKDYVYGVKVPNAIGGGTDIQHQLFAELGLSVFFPFSNRRQP